MSRHVGTRWAGELQMDIAVRDLRGHEGILLFDVTFLHGRERATITEVGQSPFSAWRGDDADDPSLLDKIAQAAVSFACDEHAGVEVAEMRDTIENETCGYSDDQGTLAVRREA